MVTKEAAMSFSQFGYPYNATSQFFVSANPSTTCCDSLSRSVCDGTSESQTAAAFCCPSYENRLLASTRTELNENRLLASTRTELNAALGMYSSPYAAAAAATHNYANYFPYSTDPSAIYSTLNPQYEIKDGSGTLHSGITQPAAYYPYDHSLSQYQYDRYGNVDFNGSARRKNATRETTSTLKTWLYEHRKNPYPTKGEKIMLAIITKMTLTQVSTWFANARRRLKKENKMTWSPKSKAGDDRKDDLDKSDRDCVTKGSGVCKEERDVHLSDLDDMEDEDDCNKLDSDCEKAALEEQGLLRATAGALPKRDRGPEISFHAFPCGVKGAAAPLPPDFSDPMAPKPPPSSSSSSSSSSSLSHFHVSDKPRIWSLARTAAAGLVPGQHRGAELRTAGDCQLRTAGGQRGALGGLRDPSGQASNAGNPFQEGPALHSKIYSAAGGYGHKALQVHCSSYPTLSDTCQYSTVEGFPSGKAKTVLSDACGTLQDDKATIFTPVMKR